MLRRRALLETGGLFCVGLLLVGCRLGDSAPPDEKALLARVRQGLNDRDLKLTSYRLAGAATQDGVEARFEFDYRSPNRMRGTLLSPQQRSFAFDGQQLFELDTDARKLTTYTLKLPPASLAELLARTFTPFAPEGFRVPLLTRKVHARLLRHPRGPEAVELSLQPSVEGESKAELEVRYLLRWPSLDFLSRTFTSGGKQVELRVEEEHCEPALGFCVPKLLAQWEDGVRTAHTTFNRIELKVPLPEDHFRLSLPAGFESKAQTLSPSAPARE